MLCVVVKRCACTGSLQASFFLARTQVEEMVCECPLPTYEVMVTDGIVKLVARVCVLLTYTTVLSASVLFLRKSKALWVRWWSSLRSTVAQRTDDDMDKVARDMVSTFRAQKGWEYLVIVGFLHVLHFMNLLRKLHRGDVWGDPDVDLIRQELFERGMVQRLIRSIFLVFITYRGHVSCSELYIIETLSYFDLALQMWSTPDLTTFSLWFCVSALSRVLCAVVIGNAPLVMTLSSLHCLSTFVRLLSSSHAAELENFMLLELITGIVAVGVSALIESVCHREMRATLEASVAAESERTVTKLLSLVCDAVVALDDGLRIKQRSPALEALLFRSQGLCDVDFRELVCEGNSDRFEDFINDGNGAQCLHLHLRDATGTKVAVQLFHRPLRGFSGQMSHLVGIREEGDGQHAREPPAMHPSEHVEFETQPSCVLEDQSSSSSVMSLSSVCSAIPGVAFVVDAMSSRLTVLSCTTLFTALMGPAHHGDALDWVSTRSAPKLVRLVRAASAGAPRGPILIGFKLPHAGKLRALCEAHLLIQDDDDGGSVHVQVDLTDIETLSRRTASNQGTRRHQVRRMTL